MRRHRASVPHTQLFTAKDLSFKIARDVKMYLLMCLVFYVSIPVIYYHIHLDYTMVDAFYFCMVTFASVGYGDIVPTTIDQRMWCCVFIVIGVGVTANLFGLASAFYIDATDRYQDRDGDDVVDTGRSFSTTNPCWKLDHHLSWTNPENIRKLIARNPSLPEVSLRCYAYFREGFKQWCLACRRAFDKVTFYSEPELLAGADVHTGGSTRHTGSGSVDYGGSSGDLPADESLGRATTWETGVSSVNRIRKIVQKYHRSLQDIRYSVLLSILSLCTLVFIGTLSMMEIEDFTGIESFFWAVTTVTSVGYGDIVPHTQEGKVFTTFYIFFSYVLMGKCLSDIILAPIGLRSKKNSIEVVSQFEHNLSADQLDSLVNSEVVAQISDFYQHPGQSICKTELMLLVLHMMGTVSSDDMLVAAEIFDRFDSSGTRGGKVSLADMQKVLLARRGSDNNSLHPHRTKTVTTVADPLTAAVGDGQDIELSSTTNPLNSTAV